MYEPENLEFHMDLPDFELEDNRTASCPAPDHITTAAPSRAQTPTSSPSDVATAGFVIPSFVGAWPTDSNDFRHQCFQHQQKRL
ncbi:hypothetical protein MRX96_005436 [Rhipicephalus microplus]